MLCVFMILNGDTYSRKLTLSLEFDWKVRDKNRDLEVVHIWMVLEAYTHRWDCQYNAGNWDQRGDPSRITAQIFSNSNIPLFLRTSHVWRIVCLCQLFFILLQKNLILASFPGVFLSVCGTLVFKDQGSASIYSRKRGGCPLGCPCPVFPDCA